jgi:hypothetical protein
LIIMSTTNILLLFNEKNSLPRTFADGFKDDLNKCLVRFQIKPIIKLNGPKEKGDCCCVIISSEDISDPDFIANVKDLLLEKDTLLINIDPFRTKINQSGLQIESFLFWEKQYETGEINVYRRDDFEYKSKYWEKVTDVAVEIQDRFSKSSDTSKRQYAYLSQDDISHKADRDNLTRDLFDLGYEVLPDKPFNLNYNECIDQIKEALGRSRLIIQIIPPVYNIHFADQNLSLTELQCNVSADYLPTNNPDGIRLIWISSAYEITDEENRVFIEKIQRDEKQTQNSTVLKSSIEDLKKLYRQFLLQPGEEVNKSGEPDDVYLIFDKKNIDMENEVKNLFSKKKLRVSSNQDGITYKEHLNYLAQARLVVLFYSNFNEEWLSVKTNDILKSMGIDFARDFERIVLVNEGNLKNDELQEVVFTDVLTDINQLSSFSVSGS